ncbi:MAG: hypothetical protein SFU86_00100 [Pirellulaceae bacterium]|nr:hypothetical protein [Pirellulaceae bacterium]
MKLALLGADDEALALVAAAQKMGHDLVAAFDVGQFRKPLLGLEPGVRLDEQWESLLLGGRADAVIVARGLAGLAATTGIGDEERRADQLRKLAQAGIPLVVLCPACEAIVGFEIDMIRRDCGGVIIPATPDQGHPGLLQLAELALGASSPLGKVEQILLDRQQADRSRAAVLARFARDVGLLRPLLGTVRSVTATGAADWLGRDPLGPKPKQLPQLANLSVHLIGSTGLGARWSIGPASPGEGARLILVGERGQARLEMPHAGNWSLSVGEGESIDLPAFQPWSDAIHWLTIGASGAWNNDRAWLDACRDQEVGEAIDRSLLRGRAIELYNEEHTEEQSFKGVMAMGGCLLMVLALGVLGVAVAVEGLQLPIRNWAIWRYWPAYLLVPIVMFLLLQLLQLAVPKRPRASSEPGGVGDPG